MKKVKVSLSSAIGLFVVGIFLGSVFTFGMQYWNASVEHDSCISVETQFISYKNIHKLLNKYVIKEIAIDCSNEQRYFIDGVSINSELESELSELEASDNISLLIHPNSDTIVEFRTEDKTILEFEETIEELDSESTGFLFLGIFMYLCSLCGLYYIILYFVKKRENI